MKSTDIKKQRTLVGRFAWLGALAIVLFQLQIALHPHQDHGATEPAESSCEVCIKLDQGGNVPPVEGAAATLFAPAATTLSAGTESFSSRSTNFYTARAPPQV